MNKQIHQSRRHRLKNLPVFSSINTDEDKDKSIHRIRELIFGYEHHLYLNDIPDEMRYLYEDMINDDRWRYSRGGALRAILFAGDYRYVYWSYRTIYGRKPSREEFIFYKRMMTCGHVTRIELLDRMMSVLAEDKRSKRTLLWSRICKAERILRRLPVLPSLINALLGTLRSPDQQRAQQLIELGMISSHNACKKAVVSSFHNKWRSLPD